jgi:hypothetical protein
MAVAPSITQNGRYVYYAERISTNTHRVMRNPPLMAPVFMAAVA